MQILQVSLLSEKLYYEQGGTKMATVTRYDDRTAMDVHSRISWAPILGGVATAFAVYILLSLLGVAIGFSVQNDVSGDTLGVGAAIWATLAIVIALFAGGWVCSRFTVGEDRTEAVLYGAILWGTMFLILLVLAGMGLGMGIGTMIGVSQGQVLAGVNADAAEELSTEAAWWAFGGTLLSMLAAIGGALAGATAGHYAGHRTPTMTGTPHPTAR